MASRRFVDSHGVEWIVLAVTPTRSERRAARDRRERDEGPPPGQPERRTGTDRRQGPPDPGRLKLEAGLARGWLVFEGGGERRRLVPVPPEWYDASDVELERLLSQATVVHVRRSHPPE